MMFVREMHCPSETHRLFRSVNAAAENKKEPSSLMLMMIYLFYTSRFLKELTTLHMHSRGIKLTNSLEKQQLELWTRM